MIISHFVPYHWGNPWYSTKIRFLEKNQQLQYNAFFFGSSRMYRQVNPQVFDSTYNSINSTAHEKLNSYNLGAPATFNPQSYYLYEKFLDSPLSRKAKYCFIELIPVDLLSDYFMHEERTSYWQNLTDFLFVAKSHYYNNKLSTRQKVNSFLNYSISYLEGLLHIGHFGQQFMDSDYYSKSYIGINRDGYFSLDYEYEITKDEVVKEHLYERKQSILEKPELIENRKLKDLNSYNNLSNGYDKVYYERILNLIQKSKQKNIDLIFVIPPRTGNHQIINLSRQIPESNIINMCHPQKYNSFYLHKYSFDAGHFNAIGADLYSNMLAKEFNVRCKSL